MYTTRIMTNAFIYNKSDLLLLHRSAKKAIHPGRWTGIGGHVEPNEMNSPAQSCLREIGEETGLNAGDLADFRLRYIILRQRDTEIRQQYVYIARALTRQLGTTDEGTLRWVPIDGIFQLDLVPTTRLFLKHHCEAIKNYTGITVGVLNATDDGGPNVQWVKLYDWEIDRI